MNIWIWSADGSQIPNTDITYRNKHRIEARYLLKDAGLYVPEVFMGSSKTVKNRLDDSDFPLIMKPLMGSGSRGVRLLDSSEDINEIEDKILYLEKFVFGKHFLAYFIGNEICIYEKIPLKNEHAEVNQVNNTEDIRKVVSKWRDKYNLLFGHLDIIREEDSNELIIVDPGTFPEFSNWKSEIDPVKSISNLILEEYHLQNETSK